MCKNCARCNTVLYEYDTTLIKIPETKNSISIEIDEYMVGVRGARLCLRCAIWVLVEARNKGNEVVINSSYFCGCVSIDTAVLKISGNDSRLDILDQGIRELKSWPFKNY